LLKIFRGCVQLALAIFEYIYSESCTEYINAVIKIRIDREKINYSDGYAALGIQMEEYGKKIRTKSEEVRYEVLSIQKLINENRDTIKNYFLEIRVIVEQLEELDGFLETRKTSLTRAVNRRLSEEGREIEMARKELLKINKEEHEVMYQNRIDKIQTAQKNIERYQKVKENIELDEEYFEALGDQAKKIQRITHAFAHSKLDLKDAKLLLQYRMIEGRALLCDRCDSILREMGQFDDPYWEYVESWSPIVRKVAAASENLRKNTAKCLAYDYLQTLEATNGRLTELNSGIVNDIYDELMENIMTEMEWKSRRRGRKVALKCSPYLYLRVLYAYYGAPQGVPESLITIDEAQNLAPEEIHLIRGVNNNRVVLNLFGDIKQHVESEKGIDSWSEIEKIAHFQNFDMRENYRNARQITEYCNRRFHLNMRAINLDGQGVHEMETQEEFKSKLTKVLQNSPNLGLRCILVKNVEEADTVLEMFSELRIKIHNIAGEWSEIQKSKWNLMTIEQVKGLEFGIVFALSGRMSLNEKYIAYTRALDELYVFDYELPLVKSTITDSGTGNISQKKKSDSGSKNDEAKPERRKRVKRKNGDQNT
ncbi:MAG: hypothetical protein LUE24_11685, partial [Lachnospiraceae bacterium]|nr:hypothetical protein [Lachnospiraceae bacterium]